MTNKEYITARVTEPIKQKIEKLAKEERRSISQITEILLEEALKARNGGKS